MHKRIIALIFALMFVVNSLVTATSTTNSLITELADFSAEEIQSIFTLLKPMLITDSGIDLMIDLVGEQKEDNDGYIGKLLGYVDKEVLLGFLQRIKLVDADLRSKLIDTIQNRQEADISDADAILLRSFINKTYGKYPEVIMVFEKLNITEGIIAALLKICVEINNNKPLLGDAYYDKDDFALYHVADALVDLIDVDILNNGLTAEEKRQFKQLAVGLGLYRPFENALAGNSGEGNVENKSNIKILYNIISDNSVRWSTGLNGSTVVEIALYRGDVKQSFGPLEKPYTVKIPVSSKNVMVYKIEGALLSLKYSVCDGENVFIRIDSTGQYGITYAPYYFEDATGWGREYIESLYYRGIINGKAPRLFAPEDSITREEFVKLIVELFSLEEQAHYAPFSDVNSDEWYYKYVATAYKNNIINGIGDNLFGTGQLITRQDMCRIIANAIAINKLAVESGQSVAFSDEDDIAVYAQSSVALLQHLKIIEGDEEGNFNPNNNATRQEAAKIIYKVLELYVKHSAQGDI
ncbi:MAG: S-layer homology domain-containing protein [Clostridiaceae bacterium]|nr:S-layer homology domain-containing protein [Clostridiaceae bacterium]